MTELNIPISMPSMIGNEKKYVNEALETGWISSTGNFINRFEKDFSNYLNAPFAVSMSNGTTALVTALKALGVGLGDEVIVPTLTFGATANAVATAGADIVFADSANTSWNIDPEGIEKLITSKTKAIIAVHLYGHACNLMRIKELCDKYGLYLIEDCAEALGVEYRGSKVGTLGDIGTFSFFGNKNISTGEGGMCVTLNVDTDEKLRILRDHGMDPKKRYWHLEAGYNHRMTNLQAAIGTAQLENIKKLLKRRNQIYECYYNELANENFFLDIAPPKSCSFVNWLFPLCLSDSCADSKKLLMDYLQEKGIDTRSFFFPLHQMSAYSCPPGDFPNATAFSKRGLNLPTYYHLSDQSVRIICKHVREFFSSQ
jgi:perosamine synthetase